MKSADIEKLLSPDAFPHAVKALELIETHISWVILTGEFAYKIKKPVDLGFIDFTLHNWFDVQSLSASSHDLFRVSLS